MNRIKKWWIAGAVAVVLVAAIGAGTVMAQTPSSTPSASGTPSTSSTPSASTTPSGTFKSNEDPTHEANESQQQEAAEDSGQGHRNCPHMGNAPSSGATPGASPTPAG